MRPFRVNSYNNNPGSLSVSRARKTNRLERQTWDKGEGPVPQPGFFIIGRRWIPTGADRRENRPDSRAFIQKSQVPARLHRGKLNFSNS